MDLTQVLEIASCTDPGMVRSHNEDSIAADAAANVIIPRDALAEIQQDGAGRIGGAQPGVIALDDGRKNRRTITGAVAE